MEEIGRLSSQSLQRLTAFKDAFSSFRRSSKKEVISNLEHQVSNIVRDSFERLHRNLLSYVRQGLQYGLAPPKKLKETWRNDTGDRPQTG